MAYQANKPMATDWMSASQSDLQGNFYELDIAFKVDHVEYIAPSDSGKHKFIHFPNQAPSGTFPPALNGNEVGLYAYNNNLFFRPATEITAGTTSNDINFTSATLAATGECRLPCGLRMKWGNSSLGVNVVSVPVVFVNPFSATWYGIQISPSSVPTGDIRDGIIAATTPLTTGFTVERSSSYKGTAVNFRWLAYGV